MQTPMKKQEALCIILHRRQYKGQLNEARTLAQEILHDMSKQGFWARVRAWVKKGMVKL